MKLKELTFTSGSDDDANLETITVEMTINEALWIARVSGQQRGTSPHNEIYDCLAGEVFNRFWDDGVDGAQAECAVEIPPIRYDDKGPEKSDV